MKPASTSTRLSDQISAMALSLESGGGEAFVLFQSAERLDALESRLRDSRQMALYLRSALADVAALLHGEQIDPFQHHPNPHALAATKASAAVRVAAKFDLGG